MKNAKRQRFAHHVARAMKAQGLSQTETAARAGIRQGTLSMLLAGKRRPTLAVALRVADALGIETGEL